jgi:hypothetical protein
VSVPALNRAGINPVGVFTVAFGPDSPTFWVLLPHKDLQSVGGSTRNCRPIRITRQRAQNITVVPPRIRLRTESTLELMVAFDGIPVLEKPAGVGGGQAACSSLRTYESHSQGRPSEESECFNTGEIDIFRKNRPRACLLLAFEPDSRSAMPQLDLHAGVRKHGRARPELGAVRRACPTGKKLSTTPGFTDAEIVTNITSYILRPTSFSQI